VETTPPSTDAPAPDSVIVESPDGDLTITVDSADFDRVSPTIEILDPADWPPEVAAGANLPGVTLYDLQPDGATFDTPVVVTRRLDAASFSDLGPFDIPLVTLLTYSEGEYELLDDLSAARLGDDVFVSGSTSHFSNVLTSSEGSTINVIDASELEALPERSLASEIALLPNVAVGPGDDGSVVITSRLQERLASAIVVAADSDFGRFGTDAQLAIGDQTFSGPAETARYDIDASGIVGLGLGVKTARFEFPLSIAPSAAALLGDAIDDSIDEFEFEAWLFLTLVPDELLDVAIDEVDRLFTELENEIERTVEVFHDAFGLYPSSTIRRYSGVPPIPSRYLGYSALFDGDLSDPRLVSAARIEDDLGDWEIRSGIECYCEYGELLFFFAEDLEDLIAMLDSQSGRQDFWAYAAANTDVVKTLAVTDLETGEMQRFQVGPTEGPIVSDAVAFLPVP
jgi:hypothetical protein